MPTALLLPLFAITALLALTIAGILLVTGHAAPQLAAHLAFALGILPLVLAAMGYFIPVLTRSGGTGTVAAWLPVLALGGGILAVFSFANDFSARGFGLAATFAGVAALGLGGWEIGRAHV